MEVEKHKNSIELYKFEIWNYSWTTFGWKFPGIHDHSLSSIFLVHFLGEFSWRISLSSKIIREEGKFWKKNLKISSEPPIIGNILQWELESRLSQSTEPQRVLSDFSNKFVRLKIVVYLVLEDRRWQMTIAIHLFAFLWVWRGGEIRLVLIQLDLNDLIIGWNCEFLIIEWISSVESIRTLKSSLLVNGTHEDGQMYQAIGLRCRGFTWFTRLRPPVASEANRPIK